MKFISLLLVIGIFAASTEAKSAETNEAVCAKQVAATIDAIEMVQQKTGEEGKLKDLTITDIKKLQAEKGSCAAMVEINKRTMQ
ncbi:MAG: hypothetical protein AB1780_02450 [Pseudomonadota bacterium]